MMSTGTEVQEQAVVKVSFADAGPDRWWYAQHYVDQFLCFLVPPHLGVQAYRLDSDHLRVFPPAGEETELVQITVVGDKAQDDLEALARTIESDLNNASQASRKIDGDIKFRVEVTQVASVEELPAGGNWHAFDPDHVEYGLQGALTAVDVVGDWQ